MDHFQINFDQLFDEIVRKCVACDHILKNNLMSLIFRYSQIL